MKVLIIGGTMFLGRHLVAAAAARGHTVTTFTRGLHEADSDPRVERLKGDRNGDVSALKGRVWDAVVDTCGYVPGAISHVMAALDCERVAHYTFISSISVYEGFPAEGVDEDAPVAAISEEQLLEAEEIAAGVRPRTSTHGEWYGALKALCERAAERAMPGRVLTVRPGLIVGAHDYTDRFTYWVRRVARGGAVLAPGRPDRRVRVIDVRDLAEWIVRMVEEKETGVFNASGAEDGLTFGRMLDVCREVSASDARFVWMPEQLLLERGVQPWSELPLWVPDESNGIFEARNDRAIARGLAFRPLAETVRATREWDLGRTIDAPLKAGLAPQRERELLEYASHSAR